MALLSSESFQSRKWAAIERLLGCLTTKYDPNIRDQARWPDRSLVSRKIPTPGGLPTANEGADTILLIDNLVILRCLVEKTSIKHPVDLLLELGCLIRVNTDQLGQ